MSQESPDAAPDEVRQTTDHAPQAVLERPARPRTGRVVAAVIGFTIMGGALLLLAAYFLTILGPGFTLIAAIIALIPLAVVLVGVGWIDRWEPEPRGALLFAFLWGATIAILVALFVDSGLQEVIAAIGGPTDFTNFAQSAIQAPIVEEVGKGIGVFLIYLAAKHHVDGPIDGIVYAAVVAAGFAFTENIQYFGLEVSGYYGEDSNVALVFFVRGILSPFAHVLFTACIGYAIGVAAKRGSALWTFGAFLVGLIPAIVLHAFWNGSTFFADFFVVYIAIHVPMFVVAVGMVVLMRRQEVRLTGERLSEYAAAGWISAAEVPSLATPAGRRQAMQWAKANGIGSLMRDYIRDSTKLAYARQRMMTGRDLIGNQADEAALLAKITDTRRRLAEARPTSATA
tara:strand:- start:17797 stop:18993 length:1197 start_codon:yes stop_codon:yes gene_type:complete